MAQWKITIYVIALFRYIFSEKNAGIDLGGRGVIVNDMKNTEVVAKKVLYWLRSEVILHQMTLTHYSLLHSQDTESFSGFFLTLRRKALSLVSDYPFTIQLSVTI